MQVTFKPVPYIEKPSFPHEFHWHLCGKSSDPLCVGLFSYSVLFCLPIIYLITFKDDNEVCMDLRKVPFHKTIFSYCSMS